MRILVDLRLMNRGERTGITEYTRLLTHHLLGLPNADDYVLFYNGFRKKPLPEAWRNHPRATIIERKIPNRLFDVSNRFLGRPTIDDFAPADAVLSPHFTIAQARRARRVVTFHDLSFLHRPDFFSLRQRFWHWLQDYRRQAMGADALIAVSEFTKSDLVSILGVPPEKVMVIYSGVSDAFRPLPRPERQAWRERRGLHNPYILFLGTLEPRKNIPLLLRAFSLLAANPCFKDYECIIAGRPGWRAGEIFRLGKSLPVANRIRFWGPVSDSDRIFLYNEADVFVYPSFFEGFGFPPLEAQACGTPAIVADRTSLAEIIGESGMRVDPWNVGELADAITETTARRLYYSERGLKNCKRFSWSAAAGATRALLAKLVS